MQGDEVKSDKLKINKNIKLMMWHTCISGIYPIGVPMIIFYNHITQSYANALLVCAVTAIFKIVLEVPSGIMSDKLGRKRTMILSDLIYFLMMLAFVLAGHLNSAFFLFVGGGLFGVAQALVSGTDTAILYETLDELSETNKFHAIYSRMKGYQHLGYVFSSIIAGAILYFLSSSFGMLILLCYISALFMLISLLTACFLVETKQKSECKKTSMFHHFKQSINLFISNKKLCFYSLIKTFGEMHNNSYPSIEVMFYNSLLPLWMINFVIIIKQVYTVAGYWTSFIYKKLSPLKVTIFAQYMLLFIRLIGAVLNKFISPFFMVTSSFFAAVSVAAQTDLTQKEFSKEQRATMDSIISFLGAIISSVVLYIAGVIADIYSPRAAIISFVVLKIVIDSVLYLKNKKMIKENI